MGTPAKVLPLLYPLGQFERTKTVLMGTNTPHTCIPGLVWQKQARRLSQFELKVGELRFPIHFVCVSAALYHRGVRGRHFPLRWIWPIPQHSFCCFFYLTVDAHGRKNVSRSCNRGAVRAFWKSSCQAGKIWRQICEETAFFWHPDFSLSDPEGNFWHTYRCSTRAQRRFLSIKVFGGVFVRSVF